MRENEGKNQQKRIEVDKKGNFSTNIHSIDNELITKGLSCIMKVNCDKKVTSLVADNKQVACKERQSNE